MTMSQGGRDLGLGLKSGFEPSGLDRPGSAAASAGTMRGEAGLPRRVTLSPGYRTQGVCFPGPPVSLGPAGDCPCRD